MEKPRSLLVMHPKAERRRSKVHYPIAAAEEEKEEKEEEAVLQPSLSVQRWEGRRKKNFFRLSFSPIQRCVRVHGAVLIVAYIHKKGGGGGKKNGALAAVPSSLDWTTETTTVSIVGRA